MIVDLYGLALIAKAVTRPVRKHPAFQDPVVSKPEVVVVASRIVSLDDEELQSR